MFHAASASDRKHMLCLMFNVTAVFNLVGTGGICCGNDFRNSHSCNDSAANNNNDDTTFSMMKVW